MTRSRLRDRLPNVATPVDELEQLLRGAELRVTRPRLAVLSAVHATPHADTARVRSGVVALLLSAATAYSWDRMIMVYGPMPTLAL